MIALDKLGHITFPEASFWCATQAVKLKFGRNKSVKRIEHSLHTRIHFYKNSRDPVDETIDKR